jgi:hypothetical protein
MSRANEIENSGEEIGLRVTWYHGLLVVTLWDSKYSRVEYCTYLKLLHIQKLEYRTILVLYL